jgi:hypothetical protein
MTSDAFLKSIQENSFSLGLTWNLHPGTTVRAGSGLVDVTMDGDTTAIQAISLVGGVGANSRVMLLLVPPSSIYIVGFLDTVAGYRYSDTVFYALNGSFNPANYPGLRAVRVRCQAGGNGGGGAAVTVASQTSGGSGGQGGGYAESFITAAVLGTSPITVTVGAGGGGNSGASGSEGGDSSFGSLVIADHGDASSVGLVAGAAGTAGWVDGGGGGVQSNTGDFIVTGGGGGSGGRLGVSGAAGGMGGGSFLGHGGRGCGVTTGSQAGLNGVSWGSGGGGAANGPSHSALVGGDGAHGLVIVDVYV